ncbi:MAG: quinolinate synthase NadA [Desulfonatronovibrio sp.]
MSYQQIKNIKKKLGSELAILAHHYQNDSIVEHADLVGDSLQLAAAIPDLDAGLIMFCGVDFMAETAAVLANPGQKVFMPAPEATCVMADMAPASLAGEIMTRLKQTGRVIPLAYVNSSIGVKAICGKSGGSVCTSANAGKMLDWAFKQGDQVLFLPDKNLGQNTAIKAGLDLHKVQTLDIRNKGANIRTRELTDKQLLLWPGVCAVHFRLKQSRLKSIRQNNPHALIVVHPESDPAVVAMADETGSTSTIISFTRNAPAASTIYIGTEDNLVHRLNKEFPDKNILPLGAGYCSNMARTTPRSLALALENMTGGNAVTVDPGLAPHARKAVETMLEVTRK